MSPTQYKAALAKLGLSQEMAGVLFGKAPRTGQSWAIGESAVPEPVAILLRLLLDGTITIEDVERARR